jgi:transcriptional regulator with XRE-family HTH domain
LRKPIGAEALRPSRRRLTYPRLFIAEWIELCGTSQTKVADKIGYSEPHLSTVITGKRPYNQEILERIATALGVEPVMLFSAPPEPPLLHLWGAMDEGQRQQALRHLKAIKGDS